MAGFTRRYGFFPGTEVIQLIEGVIIVDLPPPGAVNGVGVGTVAVVGEFADMTYATAVDSSGNVTTKARPVEVFSGQDVLDKVGGFDETLGDTGISGGSGFIAIRNKRFSRLILVPVNLASSKGVRLWRQLPTNKSATDPTPAVVLQGGTVPAGLEFKTGTSRVRVGARRAFTALGQYTQGVDGAVTAAGSPAATQVFGSAGGGFTTVLNGGPVKKGDLLVVGVISAAGAQGANANTYRVTADASSDTQLTVEELDGSSFDWTTGTSQAWRIHPASDADAGGQFAVADVGAYNTPARPLDATISANTVVSPTVAPPAPTATSWDPLSGLKLRTIASTGLVYTAAVQAPNAASVSNIDALYATAIDALLGDGLPAREVNILFTARHSDTIRTKLKSHVLESSGQGVGRVAIISPELTSVTTSAVISDSAPGVGANRAERIFYAFPGALTFVPEAVGFSMVGADGAIHTDGMLDTHLDGWVAAVLSNLPPERNPGQASSPVPDILAPIAGLQRGVSGLGMPDYIQYRAKGIIALRIDKSEGPLFQSGVTTSLTSGQKNINRRRMADFIQDSLAQAYQAFSKLPLTQGLKDDVVSETDAFLNDLLSPNNPAAQRINGYLIDEKSGNTDSLEAKGVFVVISKVRTLATADFIVIQSEVGENVVVTAS